MARSKAWWGALLLVALPQSVWALGLGGLELRSALNQPLDAVIPLGAASQEDLATLRVELAPPEAFERYGLDRPAFLTSLRFAVFTRPDGSSALRVSSTESIREPFLTFLVEARWARGRLLREYTVLLDPPTFTADPVRDAPVTAPRTVPAQRDPAAGRVAGPASPGPAREPAQASRPPALAADGSYVVQRNDTLSSLARDLRPDAGITLNQMMIGLFEANPEAFDGNINRLRAGSRLVVPDAGSLRRLSAGQATAEVAAQNRAWRDDPVPEPAPRLRLVAPQESAAPGSGTPSAAERAASEALRSEADQLRQEVRGLRDELGEARRLLELRDAELAALQRQLAETGDTRMPARPSAPEPAPTLPAVEPGAEPIFVDEAPEEAVVEQTAPPVERVTPPARVAPPPPPAPGLMDKVLGWLATPIAWIAGGVLMLLLAILVFLRRRAGGDSGGTDTWQALEGEELADEPATPAAGGTPSAAAAAVTAAAAAPVAAKAVAPGERTIGMPPVTPEPGMQADEVADGDPVAEADFHMAYGLYDQAAELVEEALVDSPGRSDLLLKLVEIHFVWGNQEGFLQAARRLRDQVGDGAEWDRTLIMARQIAPGDPLFAGETASSDLEIDFEGSEDTSMLALDFDIQDGLGTDSAAEDVGTLESDEAAAEEAFMLNIGSATATNIESGLLEDEAEDAASTMETPTLVSPRTDLAETVESPGPMGWDGADTVESPAMDLSPTVESPTIEAPRRAELDRALEGRASDQTAEINLDDLGLDLEGLDVELSDEDLDITGLGEAPIDLGDADQRPEVAVDIGAATEGDRDGEASTRIQEMPPGAFDEFEDDMFSPTGITQVLDDDSAELPAPEEEIGPDDMTRLAPALSWSDEPSAEDDERMASTARIEIGAAGAGAAMARESSGAESEETLISGLFSEGDDEAALDLEIGEAFNLSEEPTGEIDLAAEPETMTEMGTKLDLARAYIDMGDPDGARSILEEVLEEGDAAHRQEARALLESLGN